MIPLLLRLSTLLLVAATMLPVLPASAASCPELPSTMRAARIQAAGGPEALRVEAIPVPVPAPGEVLVRVYFASVNPIDWKLQEAGRLSFPATPGGDFSGEVVALGAGSGGFACGDLVAGIADQRVRGGSYAEYVAVDVGNIVARPVSLSMAEAAAYPTVAIAAWRFLIAAADLQPGERVLIHGGAGGVGSMAVQMARALGAQVIATASDRNQAFLRTLGAQEAIDYRAKPFEEQVRDVDVVIDTVGGDTLLRSVQVLRDGGRLVSMAGVVPASTCAAGRIVCPATPPWDVQRGLDFVAPLIESGALRVHIERRYPLDDIVAAQSHNRSGRTRGKVVVDMGVDVQAAVEAARIPLQAYLDGHATGLEHHFRRAFADDALLVGIRDGRYSQRSAADYIAQASSGRPPVDEAKRRRWIRSIEVTGGVAAAVIELDYPSMRAVDHMSLLKFDDGWRIAVKAYEASTPAVPPP